jgi:hypothetical protein
MPHFELFNLVKWFHFVTMSIGAGAMVVALLVSGMEEDQPEFRGLAPMIWKKVVAWSFRLAFLSGVVLIGILSMKGGHPFDFRYLWIKMPMVVLLLAASEMASKPLTRGKYGAALLALALFLLTSLLAYNKFAFGVRQRLVPAPAQLSAAPEAR